jgi:GPH family glycoside/pentoside/hexuronide:cation symporter
MSIKEKPATRAPERVNLFRSYWEVVRQKPFFTVLITYSLHMTGVGIVQASLIYFFRNIYQAEDQFGFALLFLLVSCLAMIPVWVKISRRIGKKRSYNTGMAIFAVAVMIFFVVGTRLPIWFAFVTFAVAGIGFSTHYVMPWSLIPDAVEYDFAENGKRREGIFYGMWTFTSKLGSALGLAVTGWVLEIFGYLEPSLFDAPPVQPESALLGIRLLTGPIPAVFFVLGILMLSTYPITQKAYAEIVRKSEARMAEEQQAR